MTRVSVTKWTVGFPKGVGDYRAQIELDELQGFGEKIAQGPIELIHLAPLVKCSSRQVGVPRLFECQSVASESVVVDVAQEVGRPNRVGDHQTTICQLLELVGYREPRFGIGHSHEVLLFPAPSDLGKMKRALDVHPSSERAARRVG